ncbi:MAG: DUF929 family protein [Candidatus Micrarchaeota archaeon]|nr:DUF929 family protein [Candidatus Micrarchaeota archaeon]
MDKRKIAIVVAIGILIVVLLVTSALGSGDNKLAAFDDVLASPSVLGALAVSNSTLAQIGIGSSGGSPQHVSAKSTLVLNGKPEILYVGAEYCPYCAAERWPVIIALMRFGTFSNLHYMTSSHTDVYPDTATFTFYNSTYQSSYITFVAREIVTNKFVNGTYPPLQTLNGTENSITTALNPSGSIPFIDFANKSTISGSTYSPQILQNMNWSQVAAQLAVQNSTTAQSILGSANLITAQICKATNNTPASVCSASYIKRIESFT